MAAQYVFVTHWRLLGTAQEVFDVLKNTSGYFEGGATGVLLEIVQQLKAQIAELEAAAATDPTKKEELNKILSGFTTFLDKLSEQPATLSEDLIGFVSNSYSGMKKHKKAAEMLAKIPPPQPASVSPIRTIDHRSRPDR